MHVYNIVALILTACHMFGGMLQENVVYALVVCKCVLAWVIVQINM